jgi:hypothetical protein
LDSNTMYYIIFKYNSNALFKYNSNALFKYNEE